MKKVDIDTNSLAHTKWNCKYHIVFGLCQVVLGKIQKNFSSHKRSFQFRKGFKQDGSTCQFAVR